MLYRKVSSTKSDRRLFKRGGIIAMEHYKQYTRGRKFYPYANAEIYWETFLPEELRSYAENAGFSVILCEQGEIYKPEDGIVLHCLCRK